MKKCIFLHLLTILCLIGCQKDKPISEKLNVITTTTILKDIVSHIGGPYAEVKSLMGPEVDPHLYKAKAEDLTLLKQAQLIFYHGLHLEGFLTELFEKMTKQGYPICNVSQHIAKEKLIFVDDFQHHPDPHIWLNPALWALTIPSIVSFFIQKDPSHATFYEKQGELLKIHYQKLNDWILQTLSPIPKEKRILITSHDAFNYFGRQYGFQVIGIQGISTASEAGLADIAHAIHFIQKHQVPAIFVENSVNPAIIKQIAQNAPVKIGGELLSDALGNHDQTITTPEKTTYHLDTYEGFLAHNALTLLKNLNP